MARSHFLQVIHDAYIKGSYCLDLVGPETVDAIAAARIARNIGYKVGVKYAAKRGIEPGLVRLAMQLEAMRKANYRV